MATIPTTRTTPPRRLPHGNATPHAPALAEGAPHAPASRLALAALAAAVSLASLGTSSANVALPTLATRFDAPFAAVQWVVLAYLLGSTTLLVVVGRLGDRIGRRRLLLAGIAVFTAASLLGGLAPTLPLLVVARAMQGIGAAAMTALAMAMVASVTPPERTGRAIGLLGTTGALGTALGPSLGGALLGLGGWPQLCLANVPLGLLTLGLAVRQLPADPRSSSPARARFDHAGAIVLAATLAAFAVALAPGAAIASWLRQVLALATVVGLAAFVRIERRAGAPLLPRRALAMPALQRGLVDSSVVTTVLMATLVVGPFHLARGLGLPTIDVGLGLSVGPLVAALVGLPAGRLVDRFGAARIARFGFAGVTLGALLLATLPTTWGLAAYLVPLVVLTAHYALFQAANNTQVLANVAAGERGVVSGLLQLSRNLGLISGAAGMGAVFAMACGLHELANAPAPAIAAAMRTTFAIAVLVLLLGGLAARWLGRARTIAATATPRGDGHAR